MAFSRNFLKTMGLTDEQVQAIMEEHTSVTEALKSQRDKFEQDAKKYKEDADKLPGVQKQLDDLKGGEDFQKKYKDEHQAFEDYKKQIEKDAETAKIKAEYRQLLLDEKINEKRVDSILKLTDFSVMKLDKDGKLTDLDALKKSIGDEWGEFKVSTRERKPSVATPPGNGNASGGESRARELYQKHLQQMGINNDAGKENT